MEKKTFQISYISTTWNDCEEMKNFVFFTFALVQFCTRVCGIPYCCPSSYHKITESIKCSSSEEETPVRQDLLESCDGRLVPVPHQFTSLTHYQGQYLKTNSVNNPELQILWSMEVWLCHEDSIVRAVQNTQMRTFLSCVTRASLDNVSRRVVLQDTCTQRTRPGPAPGVRRKHPV